MERTGWQIELVMPVPLGVARQKERGYNQASLLALPLAYQEENGGMPQRRCFGHERLVSQVDLKSGRAETKCATGRLLLEGQW